MIDLHSHVLPGLDDGASTLEEALALCEAAAADGIEVLAGTPHVRDDYPTTAEEMEAAVEALRDANPAVQILSGGEIDLVELDRPDEELQRFGLGGNAGWLLVETPYVGWPLDLVDRLFRLRLRGFRAVLAHPERNRDVQERPELLDPVVAGGTLVQLTAASVDGRLGKRAYRSARTLLERGAAHLLASDAHTPDVRAVGLRAAVHELGDDRLGHWLTVEVPYAILDGNEPPPRPEPRARRRLFR